MCRTLLPSLHTRLEWFYLVPFSKNETNKNKNMNKDSGSSCSRCGPTGPGLTSAVEPVAPWRRTWSGPVVVRGLHVCVSTHTHTPWFVLSTHGCSNPNRPRYLVSARHSDSPLRLVLSFKKKKKPFLTVCRESSRPLRKRSASLIFLSFLACCRTKYLTSTC